MPSQVSPIHKCLIHSFSVWSLELSTRFTKFHMYQDYVKLGELSVTPEASRGRTGVQIVKHRWNLWKLVKAPRFTRRNWYSRSYVPVKPVKAVFVLFHGNEYKSTIPNLQWTMILTDRHPSPKTSRRFLKTPRRFDRNVGAFSEKTIKFK